MSPLFGVFSRGSLVKNGCVGSATRSKKGFSVVTSPITAEREQVSFFFFVVVERGMVKLLEIKVIQEIQILKI